MLNRRALLSLPATLLAGCATDVVPHPEHRQPQLAMQDKGLNPRNGGISIGPAQLQTGDIVLSSAHSMQSLGIRMLTLSPVSHASLFLGEAAIAEAVGDGIQRRAIDKFLAEEAIVVAFRHPGLQAEHADRMQRFVQQQLGQKYNLLGVMLQAPFSVERRLCELPLLPAALRDFCVRGVGAVQLGLGPSDRFFCSQFVLEAYRRAGLPLTDADPRLLNPADLLHMRAGDVPSVRSHQALQYVGHLKYELLPAVD